MTVYLDDLRIPTMDDDGTPGHWSRLMTDDPTLAELYEIADRLDLIPGWFRAYDECGRYRPHYVVPDTRRPDAADAGVGAIGWTEGENVFAAARATAQRRGLTYGPRPIRPDQSGHMS